MILGLLRKRRPDPMADAFGALALEARRPDYFEAMGVPDTVEGRFELLMLVVGLPVSRLSAAGGEAAEGGRRLSEAFFADMDRTLREIGFADQGVAKRMKKIARAFYGRTTAVQQALRADDPSALDAVLRRNVYLGTGDEAFADRAAGAPPAEPDPAAVAALADRVRALAVAFDRADLDALSAGRLPALPEVS